MQAHHAYIYEGSLAELPALAADARERFGFAGEHHPDVHVRRVEKFGIDESRWLASAAALKSASGRALFVVGVGSITTEAQQALLKLLEEPQEGTTLVLLAPHGTFLPTIKSRVLEYPIEEKQKRTGQTVLGSPVLRQTSGGPDYFAQHVSAFLKASGKERSDIIAKMLKDDDGARERVRDFVNALEAEVARFNLDTNPKARAALQDIAMVRDYLSDRSPSLKMLLEHLAITTPTT